MTNLKNHSFLSALLAAIVTFVIGILFTANPSILNQICLYAGAALCVAAVLFLIVYFVKGRENPRFVGYTAVSAVAGVLLMIVPGLLGFLIPILFGIWLVLNSASGLFRNFSMRHTMKFWWIGLLLNILGCVIGVYVLTRPTNVMESTVRIIGIALIIGAIIQSISALMGRQYLTAPPTGDVIDTTLDKD